jgi:hypothetical protein
MHILLFHAQVAVMGALLRVLVSTFAAYKVTINTHTHTHTFTTGAWHVAAIKPGFLNGAVMPGDTILAVHTTQANHTHYTDTHIHTHTHECTHTQVHTHITQLDRKRGSKSDCWACRFAGVHI